jgi:hypothetical protein
VRSTRALDIWIGEHVDRRPVVRQFRGALATTVGDLDATVVYSDFDKPVRITLPR